MALDAALTLTYDAADGLEWMGYRGVLTDEEKQVLKSSDLPAPQAARLATLLQTVQQQTQPVYSKLVGSILGTWVNLHTYVSSQPAAAAIDPVAFFGALAAQQEAGTISDPVPQLQFSYDATLKVQTLRCTDVLTDAQPFQPYTLPPATAVFENILHNLSTPPPAPLHILTTH